MNKSHPLFFSILILISFSQCVLINAQEEVLKNGDSIVIRNEEIAFHLKKSGFKYGFEKVDGPMMVPAHPVSGLLAGEVENLSPAKSTEYLGDDKGEHSFRVTLENRKEIIVRLKLDEKRAHFKIEHEGDQPTAMALRTAGVSPGYGLGDNLINWWQRLPENKGKFQTDITGFTNYDFSSSNGYASRMVSNFAIYPQNEFALINIDPGAKIVVSTKEEITQGIRHANHISSFYYFFGDPKSIYASFLQARNENGFPVMKPKYAFYGVGWEAWGALAYKTKQETVKKDIDHYLELGYPLTWMVIGSGFWPHEDKKFESTTSFGMWDKELYPNPKDLKRYFNDKGLKFLIGLRIAFITNGPFSNEGLEKNYFLTENGEAKIFKIGFPRVPIYILNVHNPEAVKWYVDLCGKWGVDGFKEDLFSYGAYAFPDDKLNPVNTSLMEKGYYIMARNTYLSSAGELHRIEDFNYDMNQDRGPVNSLTLAYSGFPLGYMDIIGGMFGGRDFDGELSNRIKTYMMRNARAASLHASMSMGKGPWHFNDEKMSRILLECAQLHARLHPYIYSNAIKFYHDGYPHTITPLPIAFPNDPNVYGRENSKRRGFQWMIGDALMAYPLYGEDYETANSRDIYLPEGKWIDYDTGEKLIGPRLLESFSIPVEKTPLFVGGTGIVIEEIKGKLKGRIFPISHNTKTVFYGRDGEIKSTITIDKTDWNNVKIRDTTSGTKVSFRKVRHAYEFDFEEGHSYRIE